jgi:thymidylate synthase
MALFVEGPNVSAAWVEGLELLLGDHGEAVNFTVTIADPTSEEPAVRSVVDTFIDDRRSTRKSIQRVSTVANTIFPAALYVERLGEGAEQHLYDLECRSRAVIHRHRGNARGTYFERMVAWPGQDGHTFNQLDQAITRLRGLREREVHRGNQFEIGLASPSDESIALPVVVPGRDRQIIGFPCLSHVSLSLQKGVVHMAALYRNHEFLERAYGNYVGLGQLLRFVAQQSGWPAGELTCISASVTLGNFSRSTVAGLLANCREAQVA